MPKVTVTRFASRCPVILCLLPLVITTGAPSEVSDEVSLVTLSSLTLLSEADVLLVSSEKAAPVGLGAGMAPFWNAASCSSWRSFRDVYMRASDVPFGAEGNETAFLICQEES